MCRNIFSWEKQGTGLHVKAAERSRIFWSLILLRSLENFLSLLFKVGGSPTTASLLDPLLKHLYP
jgi:hypothetical protein